jgi:hypothetical protein
LKLRLLSAAFVAVLLGGIAANAQFHPSTSIETTKVAVASLSDAAAAEQASAAGMVIERDRQAQEQAAAAQRAETARLQAIAAAKAEKTRLALAAAQARKASRGVSRPRGGGGTPAPAVAVQASGDLIDRLAGCESGGNPRSVSAPYNRKGDRFYGAFQFMLSTWHSFRPGNPTDYSYAEQKKVIQDHFPVSSWRSQFPTCARRLGVA